MKTRLPPISEFDKLVRNNTKDTQPPPFLPALQVESILNNVGRARPKKPCPHCHRLFTNLATHVKRHMAVEQREYVCDRCQNRFVRYSDLERHSRKHWRDDLHMLTTGEAIHPTEKILECLNSSFKCPFNIHQINLDNKLYHPQNLGQIPMYATDCHKTGLFTRVDTYKYHLKALHFEYPDGISKQDREFSPGHCKHCHLHFPSVHVWLQDHILSHKCGYTYHQTKQR